MQVSRGASLLNPGAKFNKPLDSWSFCFKIWGQRLWPVNHQLSALPSKIKIKKKSNDSCLVWSIPVSQLLLHGSAFQKWSGRSPAQQRSSSASTQVKFIYIWNYPSNLSLYSCCIQMHLQQLQASQETLICSKLIHKALNLGLNSLSLQKLTISTNHASPKIPGHLRKTDPEKQWFWIRLAGGILLLFWCSFQETCILPLQNTLKKDTRKPLFYLNTHP